MQNPTHLCFGLRSLRLFAVATVLIGGALQAADYSLAQHRIQWTGSMPAKTHTGLLTPLSFEASITDQGTINSLEVVLDMTSIDVTDLKGKQRDKLTGHLRSEDFFFVETYPTAHFSLERHADGQLRGSITIRGITKLIEIPVTVTREGKKSWKLNGEFSFNRQDFNVNYQNSGFLGVAKDKIIRDLVDLKIELIVVAK